MAHEPKFSGGKTHLVKVTIELAVFTTKGCDDRGMKQHAALVLGDMDCNEIRGAMTDIERSGPEEESPYTEGEAIEAWEDLFREYDDAGSVLSTANVPSLSDNQVQFIRDVLAQSNMTGVEIRKYSGRGMFGRQCPGVTGRPPCELRTTSTYKMDSMGLSYILYAQD